MFVRNCNVDKSEWLNFPKQNANKKNARKKNTSTEDSENTGTSNSSQNMEKYNPVKCTECNTEVGVYDKEEIYHFFNVLASYS